MSAATAQQLRERITFRQDQPVEIQLDGDGNPTEQDGRDGTPETRMFLQGHRIMWVPADVHARIQQAQAGPDAAYAITKHRAPQPWTVIHLADEPAQAGWTAPDQQPAPRPAQPARAATPLAAAPRPRQEPTAGQPAQGALSTEQPYSTHMYACLCAAIKVAAQAETYAAQIGHPVAFETGDIRAMAATLFIQGAGR
jgi:hypothetical protein